MDFTWVNVKLLNTLFLWVSQEKCYQNFGRVRVWRKVRKEARKWKKSHSDSLDTLLYVRFAIENLEFYEWKLGDHG